MDANKRSYHRELGKRLASLRKRQELTQAELGRILGVSQQTVFAYELGDRRVSLDRLPVLLSLFRVTCDELLGMSKASRPVKRRLSPAGVRHAERFRQLSKTQQRFVTRIIDVLLEQNSPQPSVASG